MAEFYSNAARIIEKVLQKKGTPKALVIENSRIRNKKKLYALVCEAIKCKNCSEAIFIALLCGVKQRRSGEFFSTMTGKGLMVNFARFQKLES